MGQFNNDGTYFYNSFTFESGTTSRTINIPLSSSNMGTIPRHINLMFPFRKAGYTNYTNYRKITSAGWAGFSIGATGSGYASTNGNGWTLTLNDKNICAYTDDGTYYWGRLIFQTSGKVVKSNANLAVTVNRTQSTTFDLSSPGYLPYYTSKTYMLKASTSGNGTDLSSLLKDYSTWTVRNSNGNYIKVTGSFGTVNIYNGDTFRYDYTSTYVESGGHWLTTPGGKKWISDGYYNYTYYIYKNGSNAGTSSSNISIYAYCANTSYGDVVFVSK